MASLMSNIPVLRSGHLPVVIELGKRKEYIDTLARYQLDAGQLSTSTGVWPNAANSEVFVAFCDSCYETRINRDRHNKQICELACP